MSSQLMVRYSPIDGRLCELGVGLCPVSIARPGGRAPRGRVYPLSRRARARAHALLMAAADIFWPGRARGGGRGPRALDPNARGGGPARPGRSKRTRMEAMCGPFCGSDRNMRRARARARRRTRRRSRGRHSARGRRGEARGRGS